MSIFKDILNKLLHRSQPAQPQAGTPCRMWLLP